MQSNFTRTGSSPSTILGAKKLETLGHPTVKTASLCVPYFCDTIPECVGRTDGRTDGFAVAYTALAKLVLRRAVKTGAAVKTVVALYRAHLTTIHHIGIRNARTYTCMHA